MRDGGAGRAGSGDAAPGDGASGGAPRERTRRPEPRARRRPRRAFYSIGEVCRMLGLKPHVLRYWETQFDELSPAKNRAGNRVYTSEEVEHIALIKRLVHDERYTIEGARHQLQSLRAGGGPPEQATRALERSFLRSLHAELEDVLRLLDPGPVDRPRDAG